MMSNQSEAPKESSCQDWSASAASTLAADQSEHSTSRAGDSQEQSSGGVQSLAVVPNPSPAPASTPVALATASLPQQPMSHLQLVSQMVSGATTQSAQVSMQQSQQSLQIGSVSQPQTFHHLTTAQGAMHQTIQYGVAPSMMTHGAEQQTVHQQTTQAVMAHGAGQQTIQLGMGQSLLAHGVGQQTIQGLGSMFGGAQIICSSDPSNNAQMESAAMTCPQYLTSTGLTGPQFMQVPQLQVIQAGPNQFIPQQFMYQNMSLPTAVHAVQNQSGGQQLTQGRSNPADSKTPNILPAGQQLQQQNMAIRIALTNSYTLPSQTAPTKGMATVVPQQATVFGGKQVTQKQQSSSLVFGVQQPTILQSVRPAGSGSISFSPVQQAQIISNPIRFATGPNFMSNTGQIIGTNQTLVNLGQFQTVPIVQPLIASQGTTILGSQPLYIRTADTLQPQQQGIMGNVQTVTQTRHVANIAPQTFRPATTTQSRRGVQVQPNNASATHSQTSTSSSKSTSSLATPKSSAKLPTLAKISTSLAKPTAPSTSSVPVAPRPPSQSGVLPRVMATSAPVATVTAQSKPQVSCKPEQPNKTEEKSAPPAPKPDETQPVVAEKPPAANSTLKEELSSPSAKSVAAILPTSVEKPPAEVKTNTEEVKIKNGDEKTVDIKSLTEKENKVNSKPVREKSLKRSRPKILTHVIEGFIIQEAMEPFPVNRSSLMSQFLSPSLTIPDEKNIISITSQFQADSEEEEDKEQEDEEEEEEEEEEEIPAKKPRIEPEIPKELPEKTVPKEVEITPAAEKLSTPTVQESPSVPGGQRLTCEFCGKSDLIQNFARSKRFCSVTCSKRFSAYSQRKQSENGGLGKVGSPLSKGLKRPHPTLGIYSQAVIPGTLSSGSSSGSMVHGIPGSVATVLQMTSNSTECSSDTDRSNSAVVGRQGESSTPCSPPELDRVERMDVDEFGEVQIPADKHLSQWGVQDVYNFIRTLPGCGMYADEFRQQEIDGQALMLLKEDHLMTTLNVKLGPALKICAKINKLKD